MNKNDLSSFVKNIDLSHLFSYKLNHGISTGETDWKLFEPSKFIYSYFTFNMIYEIDWIESYKMQKPWDHRDKKDFYAKDKIICLLNFINEYLDSNSFYEYLIKFSDVLKLIENSKGIIEDNNIKRYHIRNYRNALTKLKEEKFGSEDHLNILILSHKIRNNIFHGYKKATDMIKSGQRNRLLDYSHIIFATNEMFFDVLKENYGYERAQDGEMKENVDI
jgi:uncharacterized protein YutE (UPF0331/DUF86 family)